MLDLPVDTMPAASVCHVLDGRSEGSSDVGFGVLLSSLQSTLHISATQLSRQHIQVPFTSQNMYRLWTCGHDGIVKGLSPCWLLF